MLNVTKAFFCSVGHHSSLDMLVKVKLALQGACGSCPSSTTTMKMGIERVLNENFRDMGGVSDCKTNRTVPRSLTRFMRCSPANEMEQQFRRPLPWYLSVDEYCQAVFEALNRGSFRHCTP